MTTGSFGAGKVFPAGSPEATLTMMFAIVLPGPEHEDVGRLRRRPMHLGAGRIGAHVDRLQVRDLAVVGDRTGDRGRRRRSAGENHDDRVTSRLA